jgi:hypothetical protein
MSLRHPVPEFFLSNNKGNINQTPKSINQTPKSKKKKPDKRFCALDSQDDNNQCDS